MFFRFRAILVTRLRNQIFMRKMRQPVIALTGGGSGGHITPLLSLAHELKKLEPECQIIYIGHKGDSFDSLAVNSHDIDFRVFIKAGKFRRYHGESVLSHLLDLRTLALNARDFFRVLNSIRVSLKVLRRLKPDVLFVKGGFVGVPVGIAARLRHVPIITHDSDTVGGLANRIVGRWAAIHATGMPAELYHFRQGTVRYTGIPLDPRIKPVSEAQKKAAKLKLGFPPSSFVVLVAGGGLGSRNVNEKVVKAAKPLLEANSSLHFMHVSGEGGYNRVKEDYKEALPPSELKRVKLVSFSDEFYQLIAAADLIISRAGATSIAEYALSAKPCIIIPSPFLAAGHQLKNAEALRARDAAVVVDEDASSGELRLTVQELIDNRSRREQLAKAIHKLSKPQAANELATIILEAAKK